MKNILNVSILTIILSLIIACSEDNIYPLSIGNIMLNEEFDIKEKQKGNLLIHGNENKVVFSFDSAWMQCEPKMQCIVPYAAKFYFSVNNNSEKINFLLCDELDENYSCDTANFQLFGENYIVILREFKYGRGIREGDTTKTCHLLIKQL